MKTEYILSNCIVLAAAALATPAAYRAAMYYLPLARRLDRLTRPPHGGDVVAPDIEPASQEP